MSSAFFTSRFFVCLYYYWRRRKKFLLRQARNARRKQGARDIPGSSLCNLAQVTHLFPLFNGLDGLVGRVTGSYQVAHGGHLPHHVKRVYACLQLA